MFGYDTIEIVNADKFIANKIKIVSIFKLQNKFTSKEALDYYYRFLECKKIEAFSNFTSEELQQFGLKSHLRSQWKTQAEAIEAEYELERKMEEVLKAGANGDAAAAIEYCKYRMENPCYGGAFA